MVFNPSTNPSHTSLPRADVLILTALKEEYDEARKVDDGAVGDWEIGTPVPGLEVAFRTYRATDGGLLRVALTWATRMRTTATADAAGRLVDKLQARCVGMSGVCAGRRGKVLPGDVLIGSILYTFDTGAKRVETSKAGTRHKRFQAEPNPYPLSDEWLRKAQDFRFPQQTVWLASRPPTLAAQLDWVLDRLLANDDPLAHPESKQRCPAWPEALKRLRARKYVSLRGSPVLTKAGRSYIEELRLQHRGQSPTAPDWRVHVAPLATGNCVMRDPKLFDYLSVSMRTVLGVDMEAAAVAAIAHARGLPWIVMKGVMDHADDDKDDQLKPFAARASAECLLRFLRENLTTEGSLDSRSPTRVPTSVQTENPSLAQNRISAGLAALHQHVRSRRYSRIHTEEASDFLSAALNLNPSDAGELLQTLLDKGYLVDATGSRVELSASGLRLVTGELP